MKLYIARHGETTWNVEKRILGNTPGELTDKGRDQAAVLATHVQALQALPTVFVSDLRRAIETAEIVRNHNPALQLHPMPALRERDFGELEGKLVAEVNFDAFWALPSNESAYGAESLNAFTKRIAQFAVELAEGHHESVLLITHIGVMNRFNYLTDPEHFKFVNYSNADLTEFDFDKILHNAHMILATR